MLLRPRNHLLLLALTCLSLLGAMAVFNYRVDPAALFQEGRMEAGVATEIVAGHPVILLGNMNERQYERLRLQAMPRKPVGTIVLGSSRALPLGGWLTGDDALNVAVPGATLEDLFALTAMTADIPARRYVIGVDPWIFNRNNNQQSWKVLAGEYQQGLALAGLGGEGSTGGFRRWNDWLQLINFDYLRESLKSAREPGGQERFRRAGNESWIPDHGALMRADGSRVMVGLGEQRAERIAFLRRAYLASHERLDRIFGLNDYVAVDPLLFAHFLAMIDVLQRRGQVTLYLAPYHPDAWPRVRAVGAVPEVESRVRQLAVARGLPLIGSYDPARAGCGAEDFADHFHPHEGCLEKMWQFGRDTASQP